MTVSGHCSGKLIWGFWKSVSEVMRSEPVPNVQNSRCFAQISDLGY